jgi:excisionase family DNA binding protein
LIILNRKEWYRPDEIAQLFNVTRKTVYLWISSEKIKAVKVCGSLRIHRTVVEKMPKDIYE